MVPHRRPEEIGVHPVHAAQGEQPREREDTEPAAGLPEPDQVPRCSTCRPGRTCTLFMVPVIGVR